ncbi:hypothetical protein NLI96_g4057 [Meripilus lineatus]|uniref:F-box domain-containing protein n=1 Tax=Meripilus lineatus TaxID=2056292 RepID=A0AAD5YKG2_9APHY|nr:hypothetical protein NLI96_g4057 [Physisporinus lineatus]
MASLLPQEIIDAVLFSLKEDKPTLQSCAMVCREWNSVVRPYLFREIRVNGDDDLYSLLKLIEDAPGIAHVVQVLVVRNLTPSAPPSFLENVAGSWILIRPLPSIYKLYTHLSIFNKVTHLDVRRCTYQAGTLWACITVLPSLQGLIVSDLQSSLMQSGDRGIIGVSTPTSRLTTLVLRRSYALGTFLKLVAQSPWVESIQSLTMDPNCGLPLWARDILIAIGPSLSHLDLCLRSNFWDFDEEEGRMCASHLSVFVISRLILIFSGGERSSTSKLGSSHSQSKYQSQGSNSQIGFIRRRPGLRNH